MERRFAAAGLRGWRKERPLREVRPAAAPPEKLKVLIVVASLDDEARLR